jgi:hypothetical protein
MLSDKCIKELFFEGKYISGKALSVLTKPFTNKYIIKGSTGIGATTAILNNTTGNYVIVSPNVGMIESKEANRGKYKSGRQFFIYQGSKDQWSEVVEYLGTADGQNAIIDTTPDQIVKATSGLLKLLVDMPVFIDEAHLYVQDADYRDSVGHFMELVYHNWKASFTLSTATPFYNFWDIPTDINLEYYLVRRQEQPIRHLDVSHNRNDIKRFVYEQHDMGRLVVVFTNDKRIHTGFRDLRVANLVGDTLRIKLAPYDRGITSEQLDYNEIDVLMLSSSYFAGFDIKHDCSILIVSDQSNDAWKVNANNIVQAYGRCRETVHQALFVNLQNSKNAISEGQTGHLKTALDLYPYYDTFQKKVQLYSDILNDSELKYDEQFREYFVNYQYVNRPKLMGDLINTVDDYHLYNREAFEQTLTSYNFETANYISENEKLTTTNGVRFSVRIKNLIQLPHESLLRDYNNIKYNLRDKTHGSYSPKLALEYLTAYLLSITDAIDLINKLDNKRIYTGEFYGYMNSFLRVNGHTRNLLHQPSKKFLGDNAHHQDGSAKEILANCIGLTDDWHMLYQIHKISNNQFTDKIDRNLKIEQAIHREDIYMTYLATGSNRTSNTGKAIHQLLKSEGITLTDHESERLKRNIRENFNSLDNGKPFGQYYRPEYLKKLMIQSIVFCLTNGKCGNRKIVEFREYNPFTALSKSLRGIIPIRYVEIDLSSANAQFVDILLGTDISDEVYTNIMEHYGLTRNQAKWKYNPTLNNHRLSVPKAFEFYKNAGYPEEKAQRLARMTANTQKGSFFRIMTEYEQAVIDLYNEMIEGNGVRFHDALVVRESTIRDKDYVLPLALKTSKEQHAVDFLSDLELPDDRTIRFHVGYYNSPELKYNGPVSL